MNDIIIPFTSMICLTTIGLVCLSKGIDGTLIVGMTALIAGIGGYGVKKAKDKKEGKE